MEVDINIVKVLGQPVFKELEKFLPSGNLRLCLRNDRKSKLGDFRHNRLNQTYLITLNRSLPYDLMLLTLLHEYAHFGVFQTYGRKASPHGNQWKVLFGEMIRHFVRFGYFSEQLHSSLLRFSQNPKASYGADLSLFRSMHQDDGRTFVYQIPACKEFQLENGKRFRMSGKMRKRYRCISLDNGKTYSLHALAVVRMVHH